MIIAESGANPKAIGAKGEVGCLQIRQGVLDDVNRFQDKIHFTREDCFDRSRSIAICRAYLAHYCTRESIGHEPTLENMAQVWNGGPSGWKKPETLAFWEKVERELSP